MMPRRRAGLKRRRARSNDLDRRVNLLHRPRHHVVLENVLVDIQVTELPLAVDFVAYAPPRDAIRLGMSVGNAELAHHSLARAIDILDPLGGRVRISKTSIHADVGIDLQQARRGSGIRGCRHHCIRRCSTRSRTRGGGCRCRRCRRASRSRRRNFRPASGRCPDPDPAAARPCRRETIHVVSGHERHHADVERAGARSRDSQRPSSVFPPAVKLSGNLAYSSLTKSIAIV